MSQIDVEFELRLRLRIIDVVNRKFEQDGYLERDYLWNFVIDGERFPLIDYSRGIRNPHQLSATLSITQSAQGPYDDIEHNDGLLHYKYQDGDDSSGGHNRKLYEAMKYQLPIILFRKEIPKILTPIAPVYVMEDREDERSFVIALDKSQLSLPNPRNLTPIQRQYAHRLARQRLHQPAFRTRVLQAYERQCAVCRLEVPKLLDAAHITPDAAVDEQNTVRDGSATVNNGLTLCKIHHAAYDKRLLGITPDYEIRLSSEIDSTAPSPMLQHSLLDMHGKQLTLPKRTAHHPDRDRLDLRWQEFVNQ